MSNSEPVLVLVEVCVTKHEAPSNPVTSSCKSDLKKTAKQKQTHTQNSFSKSLTPDPFHPTMLLLTTGCDSQLN